MVSRRPVFWFILVLAPLILAACSSTSGSLGQVFEGRILQLTVVEIDRVDELRYSTIDPLDVIRRCMTYCPCGEQPLGVGPISNSFLLPATILSAL